MRTNVIHFEPTAVYKLIRIVNSIRFAGEVYNQWFVTGEGTGQRKKETKKKKGPLWLQNTNDLRIQMVGSSFHRLGSPEL